MKKLHQAFISLIHSVLRILTATWKCTYMIDDITIGLFLCRPEVPETPNLHTAESLNLPSFFAQLFAIIWPLPSR